MYISAMDNYKYFSFCSLICYLTIRICIRSEIKEREEEVKGQKERERKNTKYKNTQKRRRRQVNERKERR